VSSRPQKRCTESTARTTSPASFEKFPIRVSPVPTRALPASTSVSFVSRADDDLMARLEEAEAPFWRHVREAVLAHCRELEEAYR
jgi:hypothetical protein